MEADELVAVQPSSSCEDRISEVYHGVDSSPTGTRRARDRIHWMCKSVQGQDVLDVGCSQGITSILLAREGYSVVGIDTSAAAIEFANKDIAKETKEVRQRVRFLQVDLFALDAVADFDSVILGEVLEHQVDPQAFLRRALTLLRVDGRIVVTTPFGYAPHDDHKSSMFLSWIYKLADLSVRVDSCEIADSYIRLTMTKLAEDQPSELPKATQLLRKTEAGTLNSQRRLHAMIDQRRKEIERLVESTGKGESAPDVDLARLGDALSSMSALLGKYDRFSEATSCLPQQIEELQRTTDELSKFRDLERLESELSAARARESMLTVLSENLKSALHELESSQREVAALRNSVSFAVGLQLVTSFRRPFRLFLLPGLMLRAVRRATAARRAPPTEVCRQLTKSGAVALVGTTPVTFQLNTLPDQDYEFAIDIIGEGDPCKKGILLEFLMDVDKLQDFLQRNPDFRRRSTTDTAFIYIDLAGSAAQRVSTIVRTGMACKNLRLSLTRYRGTAPITVIAHPMRTITPDEAIAKQASSKPVKSGPKLLKAFSILDSFTQSCLEPDVELIPVSKSRWQQQVDDSDSKLLYVESAWQGNNGEWRYALTEPEKHGQELKDLVAYCSSKGIRTLFWNKEDPANFDTFIGAAAKFEYVCTTDAGSIDKYREVLGTDNAFVLPFAAQPWMHNPVRVGETIPRIAFTGSWRGKKYPARAQWIETLLEPLAEANLLDIFDRYAGTTDDPDLVFPQTLQPAVKGGLAYLDLVEHVYKQYAAFVNVNSVHTSETMLARRVFEILACGAPVISSPSPAIERTFEGIVLSPSSKMEALELGRRLLDDLVFREDLASRGVRLVHSKHTYAHRLEEVCDRVGLPYVARKPKLVSVICVSQRPEFLAHVHAQLLRQNHQHIEFIFVQNSPVFSEEEIAARFAPFGLKLLNLPEEKVLADGLNAALEVATGEYVAKMDDDDYYGPNYLSDSLLAFDYAPGAGVVGKKSFFGYIEATDQTVLRFPGQSYRFCSRVHGATLVWDQRKLEGLEFEPVQRGTDTRFLESARRRGLGIFSTDPFNFVHVRYADKARHTWTIADEEFVSNSIRVDAGLREDVFMN